MEMNKDEALRCLDIARRKLSQGDVDGARRFLAKSNALFPTPEAKAFEQTLSRHAAGGGAGGSAGGGASGGAPKPAAPATEERRSSTPLPDNKPPQREYTKEQADAVKRILSYKSYYEVLSVERSASEDEIKRAYKKLALQFHPDKNSAPGADEAFKRIGEAFLVLSDSQKRRHYDQFGSQPSRMSSDGGADAFFRGGGGGGGGGAYGPYGSPFDGGITPEELFEMLFNGGMPGMFPGGVRMRTFSTANRRQPFGGQAGRERTSSFYGGGGGGGGRGGGSGGDGGAARPGQTRRGNDLLGALLQLLPFIFLLIMMNPFGLFTPSRGPTFSLSKTSTFSEMRTTTPLDIPYYVEPSVNRKLNSAPAEVSRLDKNVESEYLVRLQEQCYREQRIANARQRSGRGDSAQTTPLEACDRLADLTRKQKAHL